MCKPTCGDRKRESRIQVLGGISFTALILSHSNNYQGALGANRGLRVGRWSAKFLLRSNVSERGFGEIVDAIAIAIAIAVEVVL
jgi:hypothetical protein